MEKRQIAKRLLRRAKWVETWASGFLITHVLGTFLYCLVLFWGQSVHLFQNDL